MREFIVIDSAPTDKNHNRILKYRRANPYGPHMRCCVPDIRSPYLAPTYLLCAYCAQCAGNGANLQMDFLAHIAHPGNNSGIASLCHALSRCQTYKVRISVCFRSVCRHATQLRLTAQHGMAQHKKSHAKLVIGIPHNPRHGIIVFDSEINLCVSRISFFGQHACEENYEYVTKSHQHLQLDNFRAFGHVANL